MNFFRNLSLRHKQMLLMLATATAALALGFAGFLHKETTLFRESLLRYMVTRATIIGSVSSAALDFDDPKAAMEITGALKADRNMLSAALYSKTGAPLASFRRANEPTATFPPHLSGQGQEILPGSLAVWMPVSSAGEIVGCIYLKTDLDAFDAHRQELVLTGLGMLLVSLLVAAGLSSLLQGLISRPVLRLLETMKTVTDHKDFSQRAVRSGNDELGRLADGFNDMLQQVQSRDTELQQGRILLEKRVQDRTEDLELEIVQRRLSERTVTESHEFLQSTLDALSFRIAILDQSGVILSVNAGWNHFTSGGEGTAAGLAAGGNYLEACERGLGDSAEEGPAVARGIRAVLSGEVREFTLEYPCHGPEERRWFIVRVTRFGGEGARRVVVAHENISERKLAEEAIREGEDRFEGAFEHAPIGVALVSPEGRWLKVNHAVCDLVGYSEAELLASTFQDITHPADLEADLELVRRMLAGEIATYHLEKRYVHARGHFVSALLHVSLVRDARGQPLYFISQLQDITERKRQEEELLRAQTFLNSVIENLPVPVFIKEAKELRFVLWNKAGEELTGISNEEMVGKCDHDFFPGPEAEEFTAIDRQVLRSGKKLEVAEEQLQTRHKGIRTVHVTKVPIMDGDGQPKFLLGIAEDITERKRAEESLRLLRSAVEQVKESIVITDAELDLPGPRICFVNPSYSIMTGYTAEEAIGQTPRKLQGPRTDKAVLSRLRKNLEEGEVFEGEAINYRKDGTEFVLEWQIAPIRNADGKTTHFVSIQRDITKRKEAEAEMAEMNKRLLDTSRQAGMAEVATGVLHNVGNVLNSVNVSATLLGDRLRKGKTGSFAKVAALVREQSGDLPGFFARDPRAAKLPDYLEQFAQHLAGEQAAMLGEVENLRKNIEHIKDIVAMQQSYAKVSGVTETLRPAELIEDTLRMNSASFDRHAIEVVTEIADVPPIEVDKHKVLQLLVNFLRNAKHACDDSGRADKRIVLRVGRRGDRVFFAVADNGVGIPPENLKRIFNHGFTTKKDGHGFGLHSGANAATEMGGSVSVHSDGSGLGATFTLELPITVNAGKQIANAPALTIAE